MNIVKCANGHFFDSETYKICPHCGAQIGASPAPAPVPQQPQKKEKKGLFGLGGKKQKDAHSMQPGWGVPPQVDFSLNDPVGYNRGGFNESYDPAKGGVSPSYPQGNGPRTEDVPINFNQPNPAQNGNNGNWNQAQQNNSNSVVTGGKTLDFWKTTSGGTLKQSEVKVNPTGIVADTPALEPVVEAVPDPAPTPDPIPSMEPSQSPAAPPAQSAGSLLSQIRQASASDEGKTLSYFSAVTAAAPAVAAAAPAAGGTSASAAPKAIDPVVGWLVSIEGPHFGESFSIHSGMNSIGRNTSNRVVLDRDKAVSREKHAFITYEPKHRQFYVKPGDSSGLVYINGEYIDSNRQIKPREVLEIGSSKLVFVPFCTEEFGWEDVLNK